MVVKLPEEIEKYMSKRTKEAFYTLTQNLFSKENIDEIISGTTIFAISTKNKKDIIIDKRDSGVEVRILSPLGELFEDLYRIKFHGKIDNYLPIFSDEDFKKMLFSTNVELKFSESNYEEDRQVTIYVPFYYIPDVLKIISKYYPLNWDLLNTYEDVKRINRIEIVENTIYGRISPNISSGRIIYSLKDRDTIDDETKEYIELIDDTLRMAFLHPNDFTINVLAVSRGLVKDNIPKDYSIYQVISEIKKITSKINIYVITLLLHFDKENKPIYCPGIVIERKEKNGKDILNVLTPKGNIEIDLDYKINLRYISRSPLKFITQDSIMNK
ncbi:MAG: hypothetical protein QXT38_02595 [Candidatus Aenigmatarchaeota archaeon]